MQRSSVRPLTVDDAVELATVTRSGLIESRHLGIAVLVDADGRVRDTHGDVSPAVYPRSALKPLQAVAVQRTGLHLTGSALGLATASHSGSAAHVAVVERMLSDAGLDEHALGCPAAWPSDPNARTAARAPRAVTMTCSGKHAAFLAGSVHLGAGAADYLAPRHPMQRAIAQTVEDYTGERVAHWGTDGCLAPTPALPLAGLARGVLRAVGPGSELLAAVRAEPWTIEGPGLPDSVLIESTGWFVKMGAEGVLVIAVQGEAAVAVKILDGSRRATVPVALTLLARAGVVSRERADELVSLVGDPGVAAAF